MPDDSPDHGRMAIIELQAIGPSPFQRRQHFEEDKLKGLAASIQRDGLIEPIEGIVEVVDAELIQDKEYLSMGDKPADRVKTLLGKIDSVRRSRERGFNPAKETKETSNKFIGRVEKLFNNLPKPVEWLSFYNNDLPLLIDFCEEVRDVSIRQRLNRSQARALEKLRSASIQEFQRVTAHAQRPAPSPV